jgi:hypothetical protein
MKSTCSNADLWQARFNELRQLGHRRSEIEAYGLPDFCARSEWHGRSHRIPRVGKLEKVETFNRENIGKLFDIDVLRPW